MIEIPNAYIAKQRSKAAKVFECEEVKNALVNINEEIRLANKQGSFNCVCELVELYEYAIVEIRVLLESKGYEVDWDEDESLLYIEWERAERPKKCRNKKKLDVSLKNNEINKNNECYVPNNRQCKQNDVS